MTGGRFAEYDSDDEDAGADKAASRVSTIARQAEAMVLGQLIVQKGKRRQLEDSGYNRHTFNDKNLPQWFLDDERRFAQPSGFGVELPDEMLNDAKEKLKSIDASSLKKVAEAKGRKTRRLQRALTKVRKKANAVAANTDISEREKSREIEKMYAKKLGKKTQEKRLVVGRKHNASGQGKMGRGCKMVDARTRSDSRGKLGKEKRAKAGKKESDRKGSKQKKGSKYSRKKG